MFFNQNLLCRLSPPWRRRLFYRCRPSPSSSRCHHPQPRRRLFMCRPRPLIPVVAAPAMSPAAEPARSISKALAPTPAHPVSNVSFSMKKGGQRKSCSNPVRTTLPSNPTSKSPPPKRSKADPPPPHESPISCPLLVLRQSSLFPPKPDRGLSFYDVQINKIGGLLPKRQVYPCVL